MNLPRIKWVDSESCMSEHQSLLCPPLNRTLPRPPSLSSPEPKMVSYPSRKSIRISCRSPLQPLYETKQSKDRDIVRERCCQIWIFERGGYMLRSKQPIQR